MFKIAVFFLLFVAVLAECGWIHNRKVERTSKRDFRYLENRTVRLHTGLSRFTRRNHKQLRPRWHKLLETTKEKSSDNIVLKHRVFKPDADNNIKVGTPIPEDKLKKSCAGPQLAPSKPFVVIWNVPSHGCDLSGIHFDFSDFGILANPNDTFSGKENVIFYGIGEFPYIDRNGNPVYGGIPQKGNLAQHLAKVVDDTNRVIPDIGFTGAGVLDFESWRPKWETDYSSLRIYQAKSIDYVKEQHPSWTNTTQIVVEATRQFEAAAKAYMLGSLDKVRELRQSGYFGYYGYPSCWGVPTAADVVCPYNVTTRINDAIGWLFSGSNALYPRIYFDAATNHTSVHNALRRILNETVRVQAKFSGLDTPILPYAIFQSGLHLFDKSDLDLAIREPADLGASGVVFWGSSAMFHIKNECQTLQKYVREVLGPYVKSTETFFDQCSRTNCNGHGRCIRKDYAELAQRHLGENGKFKHCRRSEIEGSDERMKNEFSDTYVCRCFQGWTGPNCAS